MGETEIEELFSRTIPKTFLNNYETRIHLSIHPSLLFFFFLNIFYFFLFKKGETKNTRTILPKQIKQNGK